MQLRRTVAVDHDLRRSPRQAEQRAPHGEQRGLQDIQQIDFVVVGLGHRPGDRALANAHGEHFTALGGELLRIAQAADRAHRIKDHRRRHDRAREWTAPGLIHPGDQFASMPQALPVRPLIAQQLKHSFGSARCPSRSQ